MNDLLNAQTALDPQHNITVSASAGTGKTYLLVTRIIRLLISGAKPGNILAVTFTRKAAGEMRDRLQQQLWAYAIAEEQDLINGLKHIGIEADEGTLQTTRQLYELVLFAEQPIRLSTFHAFCQELLQRFPLEADIPPGFELLESNALLQDQAWDILFKAATEQPDSKLASSLQHLFEACNGLNNTKEALIQGFLNQRSNWWAFTQNRDDPVEYAIDKLRGIVTIVAEPYSDFISQTDQQLKEFSLLLKKHPTATNISFADSLETAFNNDTCEDAFKLIAPVFLTKESEPRKRSYNKTLAKKMGEEGANRFISLHEILAEKILQTLDYVLNQKALDTNSAWYFSGQQLLEHYQRIKREQRFLDFTDLEWKTYQLLHQSDSALWVQYKLDQKIDHLLIDEFQDTNPTQWQLILPILQEIASHNSERNRSVFIVGDQKQSIYSFRGANPELQNTASDWLRDNLRAHEIPLSASWRSSPAIINYVNHIFEQTDAGTHINAFRTHSTHKKDYWGYVECLPLQTQLDIEVDEPLSFRNPLTEPRSSYTETAHYLEGTLIANKIHALINQNILIEDSDQIRTLNYSDIYILFRNRSHVGDYEQALADAAIPFIGNKRNDLLDSLEVLDMEALLTFLTTPFNNLALAQILKSPIFSVSDDDLMLLASTAGSSNWFERLQLLSQAGSAPKILQHAFEQLCKWQNDAEHLPTHDLLDRIYHQGNVLERYAASTPFTERAAVQANLIRFIEMSLEIDSGRYPSTIKFLAQIKKLKQTQYESTDSPDIASGTSSVRLLTIHAAKGLEAPVIFLADSASISKPNLSYKGITHWPTGQQQPEHFYLSTTQANMPSRLKAINDKLIENDSKEAMNLLYVALTRAQNILFICGSCKSEYAPNGSWYQILSSAFTGTETDTLTFTHKSPQTTTAATQVKQDKIASQTTCQLTLDALSNEYQSILTNDHENSPAFEDNKNMDDMDLNSAQQRGILIHDYLRKFTNLSYIESIEYLRSDLEILHNEEMVVACRQQAWDTAHNEALAFLFNADQYLNAYNEISIQYESHEQTDVNGVIDRLVEFEDSVWIIDFKTEPLVSPQDVATQAAVYRSQLEKYSNGVKRIWPTKKIICAIIFTAIPTLYQFN